MSIVPITATDAQCTSIRDMADALASMIRVYGDPDEYGQSHAIIRARAALGGFVANCAIIDPIADASCAIIDPVADASCVDDEDQSLWGQTAPEPEDEVFVVLLDGFVWGAYTTHRAAFDAASEARRDTAGDGVVRVVRYADGQEVSP